MVGKGGILLQVGGISGTQQVNIKTWLKKELKNKEKSFKNESKKSWKKLKIKENKSLNWKEIKESPNRKGK